MTAEPLVSVRGLVQQYAGAKGRKVQAVSGVSFDIARGEILGLVGESGCGKTTLARTIMQEPRPLAGEVVVEGIDLARLGGRDLVERRRRLHMVFQDPFGSLNPRWSIGRSIAEGCPRHDKAARAARVDEVLRLTELDPERFRDRRPHQLSGGQCQRAAIARALAAEPAVLIFDEAVSSLDVSIQAQILNLLEKLRREVGLTALFIAHNLAVVKHVSDRVAVMYLGKLCEVGPSEALYRAPLHPYAAALIASIPSFDDTGDEAVPLGGDPPSPTDPPSGCRFRTRCPRAQQRCADLEPVLAERRPGHQVACHFPLDGSSHEPRPETAQLGSRDPVRAAASEPG